MAFWGTTTESRTVAPDILFAPKWANPKLPVPKSIRSHQRSGLVCSVRPLNISLTRHSSGAAVALSLHAGTEMAKIVSNKLRALQWAHARPWNILGKKLWAQQVVGSNAPSSHFGGS
ncbi:hypothetical protein Ancab_009939 [Ancistrocladus abbreviatus]